MIRDRETKLPGKLHTSYYQNNETQQTVCISRPVFQVTTEPKQSPVFFYVLLFISATRERVSLCFKYCWEGCFDNVSPSHLPTHKSGHKKKHIPHDDQFRRFTKSPLCFISFHFSLLCYVPFINADPKNLALYCVEKRWKGVPN